MEPIDEIEAEETPQPDNPDSDSFSVDETMRVDVEWKGITYQHTFKPEHTYEIVDDDPTEPPVKGVRRQIQRSLADQLTE